MNTPVSFDSLACALDFVLGEFVSTLVGLPQRKVDETIWDVLERIGELLDVAETGFESRGLTRAWTRPGSTASEKGTVRRPAMTVGGPISSLTVEWPDERHTWPPAIEHRLRMLADLMGVAVQRCQQVRELEETRAEISRLITNPAMHAEAISDDSDFEDIIGDSPALRVALSRVLEVAGTDASVVLLGETGTGKELFARAVHNRSARRDRPFVCVNCAALPQTLIESELFGHERGAFTGAVTMRQGRFELAHGGTIFLDEIGDLPADVQAKLLRVLQESEFERVGSSQSRKVDVRVVAATHHDLEAAVSEGRFRTDLYYRLNVFPITLPPLRERLDDIPRLVWFFVNRRQRALNRKFTKIPTSVLSALQQHSWPGNVRELQNVVERAMIHSTGDTLWLDEGLSTRLPAAQYGTGTLEATERRHIEEALRRCGWRINGPGNTAEVLGLHPNTLRFRMRKLGIQRPAGVGNRHALKRLSA